ncbi:MAG: BMP family ABC transporter substrate-binding protein [Clostridia bacterium]|nr:BMP family ABC transporter substrate-binding protein [Clostridia bacterium]
MTKTKNVKRLVVFALIAILAVSALVAVFAGCQDTETFKVGVLHINPTNSTSGYTHAHQQGIEYAKAQLGLSNAQFLYKDSLSDTDNNAIGAAIQELIDAGCKMIIGTSFGYQDQMLVYAKRYPNIIFSHGTGYLNTMGEGLENNMNNYFGRIYQVRYLSGIAAGMKTSTGKLGYVCAQGTAVAECTSGVNAFTLGAQAAWEYRKSIDSNISGDISVDVRILNSWYDPANETAFANALLDAGCDVITQHCDTENPSTAAKTAGKYSIGYNSDMGVAVKNAGEERNASVLTSVVWNWGVYYKAAIEAAKKCFDNDGNLTDKAAWIEFGHYYGSFADGLYKLADFSTEVNADTKAMIAAVETIMSDDANLANWDVFSGKVIKFTKNTNGSFSIAFEEQALLKADGTPAGEVTVDNIKGDMPYWVKGVIARA